VLHTGAASATWTFAVAAAYTSARPVGFQVSPDAVTWYDATASATGAGATWTMPYAVTPAAGWVWRVISPASGWIGPSAQFTFGQGGAIS
jgi:hypothetical protein